jgi:hypothetical protein
MLYITNILPTSYLMGKNETIPPKHRNETRVPTLSTLIQHSPRIPSQSNKARRRNKSIQKSKETVKPSLFVDDMILYFKDPKDSTPKI